jgi:hypothetical protein
MRRHANMVGHFQPLPGGQRPSTSTAPIPASS